MRKDFVSRLNWNTRAQKKRFFFQVRAVLTKLHMTNSTDTR